MRILMAIMVLLSLSFAVTGNEQPITSAIVADIVTAAAVPTTSVQTTLVTIVTTQGKFVCELYPTVAPKTVENFLKLSRDGFYTNLKFHRIIPGFVAQGGDPLTRGVQDKDWTINPRVAYAQGLPLAGTGGPGYTVKAEFNNYHHETGTLSMARSQDPDSAGSQFYICLAPQPHLDGNYTVFGKVIEGMDVVLKLKVGDAIQSIAAYPVAAESATATGNVTANKQ